MTALAGWPDFLGSELTAAERDHATARVRVIPMPLERTVSFGAGTAEGPRAILEASHELERLWRGKEPCEAGIVTECPVPCDGPLPQVMDAIAARTEAAVAEGRLPLVLGGEHSLTYGAVTGAARVAGRIGVVQIDAHADLRAAYQGEPHSHASVMHLLSETGLPIAQYGVRALCREEVAARARYGVHFVDGEALVTGGIAKVALPDAFPETVWISLDVDGLDPAIMPATGTPVPGGLGFHQTLSILRSALGGRRVVGADLVELAPRPEHAHATFTAAQLAYALMAIALGERA